MADAVLSFALEQLSTFLREESGLLGGLRDEVQHIKDELEQMKGFLTKAEAIVENNPDLRVWISQLRDVAYDAEDVLDEFILRFKRHYNDGFFGQFRKVGLSIKSLTARHQLATKIRTIRDRIKNISDAHKSYQNQYDIIEQGSSSLVIQNQNRNTWYDSRGDALFVEEEDLVGIERPKKKLMDMILVSDYLLHVVAIVGMGGLGKTTLVKKVYDDGAVKRQFKHHAWIAVSQTFKIEILLIDVIQQLSKELNRPIPDQLNKLDIISMKQLVRDILNQQSFIIVFDDVWRTIDWDALRVAFPKNNGGSVIIITTRITKVAQSATRDTNIYSLKPLTKEESWNLFCKKAFGSTSCLQPLEKIAREITERCAGLPLAIVVIGGVLATKSYRTEEWDLFNRSLYEELASDDQLENMMKLLSLSYYEMPNHLRICFLYLSILPEDVSIEKNRLIRLWIAEGFVQKKEGMTLEEVGESYVNEFINRSLLQVADTTIDGRAKACQIHDIIQQFILRKAREHNVTIIFSQQRLQIPDKVRRLVIHKLLDDIRVNDDSLKCLRSLILFESVDYVSLSKLLSNGLHLLKMLDLRGASLEVIPHEIFKLFHLKYLSLRSTLVKIVPKSIRNLQKLETLDLRYTNVRELPVDILKLQQLRHLLVGDKSSGFQAPAEIGNLQSLQSLHNINGDMNILKEIGKLSQLRKLGITNLKKEDGSQLCSSLEKLSDLRSLRVQSTNKEDIIDLDHSLSSTPRFLRKLRLAGKLQKVPQWVLSLHGLTTITLCDTRMSDEPMEFLQDLPNLMHLNLQTAYEGEGLHFKAEGFQQLRMLQIWRFYKLKWVKVENGAMPLVDIFRFGNCRALKKLPVGIEHLVRLKRLELCNMGRKFEQMLVDMDKESVDFKKIAHIPHVIVSNWVNGVKHRHQLQQESNRYRDQGRSQKYGERISAHVEMSG